MSKPNKKIKVDKGLPDLKEIQPNFSQLYDKIVEASRSVEEHPFKSLLNANKLKKHPILQVIQSQNQVYKTNPQKRKKPIQTYLDTINHLYKKRDLDILINPITPVFVFQRWAPRQIAIFEEAILKFGKQFEFIAELIETKNPKDVYEFYLQWKSTSHYKSYKSHMASSNRSNLQDMI